MIKRIKYQVGVIELGDLVTSVFVQKSNPYHDEYGQFTDKEHAVSVTVFRGMSQAAYIKLKETGVYEPAAGNSANDVTLDLETAQYYASDKIHDESGVVVKFKVPINALRFDEIYTKDMKVLHPVTVKDFEIVKKSNPYHDVTGAFTSKDKAISGSTVDDYMELYHGTTEEVVRDILLEGLRCDKKHNWGGMLLEGERKNSVYGVKTEKEALTWANLGMESAKKVRIDTAVVFKVLIAKNLLKEDEFAPGAFRVSGNIPAKWIVSYAKYKRVFDLHKGMHWEHLTSSYVGKIDEEMVEFFVPVLIIEMVQKADMSGRYVTPFVDFSNEGDDKLQLIASLNSSRLAIWGFTAEAEIRNIKRYAVNEIQDARECGFCRMMHGKEFSVEDARTKVIEVLNVQDPNDLRTVQPWPKQTKQDMEDYAKMSEEDFISRGWHIPPYHPWCRGGLELVGEVQEIGIQPQEKGILQARITQDTFKELGETISQAEADHWNAYVGMSPVEIVSELSGMDPKGVLDKLGMADIKFFGDGNIGISVRGIVNALKYQVGTVLDPYTGTFYLTQADLIAGSLEVEQAFVRRLFAGLVGVGSGVGAKELMVATVGDAIAYTKLGFVFDSAKWQEIRLQALDDLLNGYMKPVYDSMAIDQQTLVQHLLLDMNEASMITLVDLDITYEGKTLGEWILHGVQGQMHLDLTDTDAIKQMKKLLE